MPRNNDDNIIFENATLKFANFAGVAKKFNDAGKRNFNILLTPEQADELSRAGWNVKSTSEYIDGDGDTRGGEPILPVSISYNNYPPNIQLVSSRGRTPLTEDLVEMLDYAAIRNVDVVVRPYHYDVNGKTGIKAYVKSMFVTIDEDPLEARYADIPLVGKSNNE